MTRDLERPVGGASKWKDRHAVRDGAVDGRGPSGDVLSAKNSPPREETGENKSEANDCKRKQK